MTILTFPTIFTIPKYVFPSPFVPRLSAFARGAPFRVFLAEPRVEFDALPLLEELAEAAFSNGVAQQQAEIAHRDGVHGGALGAVVARNSEYAFHRSDGNDAADDVDGILGTATLIALREGRVGKAGVAREGYVLYFLHKVPHCGFGGAQSAVLHKQIPQVVLLCCEVEDEVRVQIFEFDFRALAAREVFNALAG